MILNAGDYPLWPSFTLKLPEDLEFSPDHHYYLQGNNGSGKSSFIKRLLLPKLKASDSYHMYWEQQIEIQRYVISAHAAMHHQPFPANSEQDAMNYLIQNLKQASSLKPRPAYFIVDECTRFEKLLSLLQDVDTNVSIIYSHHDGKLLATNCHTIQFTKVNSTLSIVHATAG